MSGRRHPRARLPAGHLLLALSMVAAGILAGCTSEPAPECPFLEDKKDGWDIQITLLDGRTETKRVLPSPRGLDHDRDEVDDCQEFLQGTDPRDADTSGNGLLDGMNVVAARADAHAVEWIERGIAFRELDDGRLEFQGAHSWRLDSTKQDTVGSGILDGEEVSGFGMWILGEEHWVTSDPMTPDTSGDGLRDGFKRQLGLNVTGRDTDGDGIPDGADVNPWLDFELRLEVVSLNLTNDPQGRTNRALWVYLHLPDDPFQSAPNAVTVGSPADGGPFSSPVLNPSDSGGNLAQGQYNVTFAMSVLSSDNDQGLLIDMFSHTVGSASLIGAIHSLTGELAWAQDGQGRAAEPWPETATFHGAHGDITFRLVPVWPEAWQRCIDDGCRHGEGEFPWR